MQQSYGKIVQRKVGGRNVAGFFQSIITIFTKQVKHVETVLLSKQETLLTKSSSNT